MLKSSAAKIVLTNLLRLHYHSHRRLTQRPVDRGNVEAREDVSVHVVDTGDVIHISRIVEQFTGLVGKEVPVDHSSQHQVVYDGGWGGLKQTLDRIKFTCGVQWL